MIPSIIRDGTPKPTQPNIMHGQYQEESRKQQADDCETERISCGWVVYRTAQDDPAPFYPPKGQSALMRMSCSAFRQANAISYRSLATHRSSTGLSQSDRLMPRFPWVADIQLTCWAQAFLNNQNLTWTCLRVHTLSYSKPNR